MRFQNDYHCFGNGWQGIFTGRTVLIKRNFVTSDGEMEAAPTASIFGTNYLQIRLKTKNGTLDDPGPVGELTGLEVGPPYAVMGPAIRSGVFFRPEENTHPSERVDDAGVIELEQIHIRYEYDRFLRGVLHLVVEFAVDFDFHGFGTMSAFGANGYRQVFIP